MRGYPGVAQFGGALALGARGQVFKSPHPDHAYPVAQLRVIGGISKQATGSKKTLVYTIWPSSTIGPQRPNDPPRCILAIVRVAKYRTFLYNHASRFLRPTGITPEFPLRCP